MGNAQLAPPGILTGADRTDVYFKILSGKKIGLVVNHTSLIDAKGKKVHLVDSLLSAGFEVVKIFAPEHGFRGKASAGEALSNTEDKKTGLPIISLYGAKKKPSQTDLSGLDLVIFDIQDVGVRFYTYISTMTYVMEACAEKGIPVMILDRPNPNGRFVDGPVLENEYQSFVGLHPVPVLHGMTVGEYAKMVNGEGWLSNGITCDLTVIPCVNWIRQMPYPLPVPPSPNLPNAQSVTLYPSLCFFEGTIISLGRGTDFPFQVYGHPALSSHFSFSFVPKGKEGASSPVLENKVCYGEDLRNFRFDSDNQNSGLNLNWLIKAYELTGRRGDFFNSFFDKLAGNEMLRLSIIAGMEEKEIQKSWEPGLEKFKTIRAKYLLYP